MNNDLISREAVIDRYYAEWEKQDICDGSEDRNWLMQCIDEAPAVDAVEVVHGRWIVIDDDYGWDSEMDDEFYYVIECECSECHERVKLDRPNYCPNCGARMQGGSDE